MVGSIIRPGGAVRFTDWVLAPPLGYVAVHHSLGGQLYRRQLYLRQSRSRVNLGLLPGTVFLTIYAWMVIISLFPFHNTEGIKRLKILYEKITLKLVQVYVKNSSICDPTSASHPEKRPGLVLLRIECINLLG